MNPRTLLALPLVFVALALPFGAAAPEKKRISLESLNVEPPHFSKDPSVKLDYDIVYVRTPRDPSRKMMFTEANHPIHMDAGGDLVLLHPDGKEEVLVKGGT